MSIDLSNKLIDREEFDAVFYGCATLGTVLLDVFYLLAVGADHHVHAGLHDNITLPLLAHKTPQRVHLDPAHLCENVDEGIAS